MSNKTAAGPPYEMLANAVIIQASGDYRAACRRLIKLRNRSMACRTEAQRYQVMAEMEITQARLEEVAGFFVSQWFEDLTDADGEYLLRKLNEEVRGYE